MVVKGLINNETYTIWLFWLYGGEFTIFSHAVAGAAECEDRLFVRFLKYTSLFL